MSLEEKRLELTNLQKLHSDLEKQMMRFDEIIPYERQTTSLIFSPRLLNIMLACGPQIESLTRWIASWCNMELIEADEECEGKTKQISVPKLIHRINEKGVLSKFPLYSNQHKLQFTPFVGRLDWWDLYNNLKHGLANSHQKINYRIVMDALAALSALHCLAEKLAINEKDNSSVMDGEKWIVDEEQLSTIRVEKRPFRATFEWSSILFMVRAVYNIW